MKIADNIKSLRKMSGLSQEKLAEKVGVSRQSVSKWETGEAYPEMPNILALCSVFHCRVVDIVDVNSADAEKLDQKTRDSLAEFERKDRKRLKIVSKIIYVIAKIAKYLSVLSFILIAVVNYALKYAYWNYIVSDLPNYYSPEDLRLWHLFQYGGFAKSIIIIAIIALFIMTAVYTFKLFLEIERLFKRINKNLSPFLPENILGLKKIARYVILSQFLPIISKLLMKILVPDYAFSINLQSIFTALIVVALVYVFRYGYLLAKSNNK